MQTLVLFAKQPIPGQVKTRLAATWGADQAAGLYECFLRDQFERFACEGDRRVVGYSPATSDAHLWFEEAAEQWQLWPQPETDLGGRMAACFDQWCAGSNDRLVLIGSDSPNLPSGSFDQAFALLEGHDVVLGPSADGASWLVGLRGSAPQARAIFDNVDWSTAEVFQQTVERIRSLNLKLSLLPLWFDVDTEAEVATLRGLLAADEEMPLPRTREFLARIPNTDRS